MEIKEIREYKSHILAISKIANEPFKEFKKWIKIAQDNNILDFNAMTLSTVSSNNIPSSRIVLLKQINKDGLIFYTNYRSNKSIDLNHNKNVAANFYWAKINKQIRINGLVNKIPYKLSNQYFLSRPRTSMISSIISKQSSYINSINSLEKKLFYLTNNKKILNNIKCPKYWGGYIIKPYMIEFWQGKPNRMHDRILFIKQNKWVKKILSP
ncbi:MAG: pyridoxamine 5'-phosphate oxidase [Bacteroides sp.]|nr:MAG: pyridoxamine 5'-phosphate oxidase [Bacteroides sp.]